MISEPALFRLRFNFSRVCYHVQKIKHYSTKDKLAYCKKSLKAIKGRLKRSMGSRLSNTRQHADSQMPQSLVDVHASDMYGFTNCVPQLYPGSAILFRPAIRARDAYKYPNRRWAQLITGGLEIQEVPGDSDSMWITPNAKGMATAIDVCLARIRAFRYPGTRKKADELR